MKNYLVQAFESRDNAIKPQFDRIMDRIKKKQECMRCRDKESIVDVFGKPVYPEGGEWMPSDKKYVYYWPLLPEVITLLSENGFDVDINDTSIQISWEHFENGRKGIITHNDLREKTLEEKIKHVLGDELELWDIFREILKEIKMHRTSTLTNCWCRIHKDPSPQVAEALALLGYDVTLVYYYLRYTYPSYDTRPSKVERTKNLSDYYIDWSNAKKGKIGTVETAKDISDAIFYIPPASN